MKKKEYYRMPWEVWYALAKQYYEEHQNLLIPALYVTKDGYRLGRWIERQRANYHYHRYRLTDIQIAKLSAIHMEWRLENRYQWKTYIKLCKAYYATHKNLQIPKAYRVNGIDLGLWLQVQKKKKVKALLSEEQIHELESYGIVWQTKIRKNWEDWYQLACTYYEQYHDLQIPVCYQTEKGERLGIWISLQRMRYKGSRKPEMKEEEIHLLNKIHMQWNRQHA